MRKTIGILTAGSDCPGLNAVIRGIGKAGLTKFDDILIGFQDGFEGLIEDRYIPIEAAMLSNILTTGGTLLGTSRLVPQSIEINKNGTDLTSEAVKIYKKHSLDTLICIGGNETLETVKNLAEKELNVIMIPKAIDNNIPGTDTSIGYATALEVATEAIDRLHSTAHANHRIVIVEIAGLHAGWLAIGAGMAGGADVILIPEIPYDIEKIADAIQKRNNAGKHFSLIVVAEGAISKEHVTFYEDTQALNAKTRSGKEKERISLELKKMEKKSSQGNTLLLANRLEKMTNLETRPTILGYLLRGGSPSAADRILASQLGTSSVDFTHENLSKILVAYCDQKPCPLPLSSIQPDFKRISLNHPMILAAREVGTHLGD